ncbi:DNA polymerase [Saltwater crocodilepox virus]|nr:DNA polymerase [Saltwater crocodilepox virus]AVD69415.1 DNA polymerase [Saltwater crocodilepox virus]QGT46519.1 ORF080 [Saltwater crocodilepox virus]QGT46735.1 ORF080 [Saltwater crocodilepox virus]QGT46951.1 ORF080 [Saltwater crocodilepox virus]
MDIKCLNWFENLREKKFLYLKARTSARDAVFIRFDIHSYSVTDDPAASATAESLGQFCVMHTEERVVYSLAAARPPAEERRELYLVREALESEYLTGFLRVNWFFVRYNIDPSGCYRVAESLLSPLGRKCYHCFDPGSAFATPIPIFQVPSSYLFFDIECRVGKKFPSAFSDPVSHVSFVYVDREGAERRFTLVNSDLLPAGDPPPSEAACARDVDTARPLTFCAELVLLRFCKSILEQEFDYVVTFNGHNFDIRYIQVRLHVLAKEEIFFSLPDGSERVRLAIYERNLNNHRSQSGGLANVSYHINNNNGSIFFDLYNFIKREERLECYRLDVVSKNAFRCHALVESVAPDGAATFREREADDLARVFREVLSTANYVTVGGCVHRIAAKEVAAGGAGFRVTAAPVPGAEYAVGSMHLLAFGKDDIDLQRLYGDYGLATAETIAAYCLHDASLCKYIWNYYSVDCKIGAGASAYLLPQYLSLEYKSSTLIKGPTLRILLENRIVLLRRGKPRAHHYVGGKVFAPANKVFSNNVIVFDYNSLYPNVCMYANLSPETLVFVLVNRNRLDRDLHASELRRLYPFPDYVHVETSTAEPNAYNEVSVYSRRREGLIPKLLANFIGKRKDYKARAKRAGSVVEAKLFDSMQYVYKIVANSVYGLMGFRNNALFSKNSAKTCTAIGRAMIEYLDEVLNGSSIIDNVLYFGRTPENIFSGELLHDKAVPIAAGLEEEVVFRSVYGDTDSIFLEINRRDVETALRLAKIMEEIINDRVLFGTFRVEFEAVYKNLIIQSKKKYTTTKYPAGFREGDVPILVNKGTSETRRDISAFHKELVNSYKTKLIDLLERGRSSAEVSRLILRDLETFFEEDFRRPQDAERFLISRMHHNNYKSPDNPNFALINAFNAEHEDKIEIGERYHYLYVCDAGRPWTFNPTDIKSYERVYRGRLPDGSRIFLEIYYRRVATEVVNLIDDRPLATDFFRRVFGSRPLFSS